MFSSKNDGEWNFVEYAPQKYGGYIRETRSIINYQDAQSPPEISEYSTEIPERESKGWLYAYRLTKFKYPLLRSNGASPVCIADVLDYDYTSKKLLSYSSGLINNINKDSISSGLICFKVYTVNSNFTDFEEINPPQKWDDIKVWCANSPRRISPTISGDWVNIVKSNHIFGSNNHVTIKEIKSPWKIARGYKLQDAYLVSMELTGESEKTVN
jgi:hypothetical protein